MPRRRISGTTSQAMILSAPNPKTNAAISCQSNLPLVLVCANSSTCEGARTVAGVAETAAFSVARVDSAIIGASLGTAEDAGAAFAATGVSTIGEIFGAAEVGTSSGLTGVPVAKISVLVLLGACNAKAEAGSPVREVVASMPAI